MRKLSLYSILTLIFLLVAVALRLVLYWSNPPDNTFDDHYEPIFLIVEEGQLPEKDDCWECFQPPVFYLISAAISQSLPAFASSDRTQQLKLLQFLPTLYGVLTLPIIYLILKRINISSFARTLAFGMVCFLPRHIYMSAMHTNDTLSYLLVSLSMYLMLVAIDHHILAGDPSLSENELAAVRPRSTRPQVKNFLILIALAAAILLALLSKSTALVLLPVLAMLFSVAYAKRLIQVGSRTIAISIFLFFIPMVVVGNAALADLKAYGTIFPLNVELLDTHLRQPPGSDKISFSSFKPWTTIEQPLLAPENVTSFWTLIYSRMWFDMEPKYLQFTDPNVEWWEAYDYYLNRHDNHQWPGFIALSSFTRLTGSTLIALGLVPLLFLFIGLGRAVFGKWSIWSKSNPVEVLKVQIFVVLLIVNLAGILYHAYRHPYYSFMKAAFVLNALPAMALFLSLGLMWGERYKAVRWGTALVFGMMFLLTSVHILHICQALEFGSGQL